MYVQPSRNGSELLFVEDKERVEDINGYIYFKEYTDYEIVVERKNELP